MKNIFVLAGFIIITIIIQGCASGSGSDSTVEVSVATFNDEVVKYPINVNSGLIDTLSTKIIAGHLTGIKVPIDIETDRGNRLFILNQGTEFIRPQVTIYSDTAYGNIAPERVINVDAGLEFTAVGLAIAERTDFFYVSYFSKDSVGLCRIFRFDMRGGPIFVTNVNAQSIGDIEMDPSGSAIFAADPIGRQVLRFNINSSFELQPHTVLVGGNNTGLRNPNSLAVSNDTMVFTYDIYNNAGDGNISGYNFDRPANTSPVQVIWSYCPGKTLLQPYGLAVVNLLASKVIVTASGNSITTFANNSQGCADTLQRFSLGAPCAITFDRALFR